MAHRVELGVRSRLPRPAPIRGVVEHQRGAATSEAGWLGGGLLGLLRGTGLLLVRQSRGRAWMPVCLWMGLIWFMSSLSNPLGREPRGALAYFGNLAHPFEYGVLTLLLLPTAQRFQGWIRFDRESLGGRIALILTYAGIDEFHQSFVLGRHSSPLDWLADATGMYCTLKIAAYISDADATSAGVGKRCLYGVFMCCIAASFTFLEV
ncbi:MAG TPA: VanZ family protein [Planctomycetes bacterium]|nr:VanZ family protein [Planctomycetota bacterium]HIK60596.1 VanZ family protein [Planctomycetota bacterium]